MEFAAQIQHRSWGEPVDREGKVVGASRACTRGARTVTKDMGLRPEPMTYRASTYLGVLGSCRYRPIFAVPAEVPEDPKALYPLAERLAAV